MVPPLIPAHLPITCGSNNLSHQSLGACPQPLQCPPHLPGSPELYQRSLHMCPFPFLICSPPSTLFLFLLCWSAGTARKKELPIVPVLNQPSPKLISSIQHDHRLSGLTGFLYLSRADFISASFQTKAVGLLSDHWFLQQWSMWHIINSIPLPPKTFNTQNLSMNGWGRLGGGQPVSTFGMSSRSHCVKTPKTRQKKKQPLFTFQTKKKNHQARQVLHFKCKLQTPACQGCWSQWSPSDPLANAARELGFFVEHKHALIF